MSNNVDPADPPDQPASSAPSSGNGDPDIQFTSTTALRTTSVDDANWLSLKLLADEVDCLINSLLALLDKAESPSPEISDTVQLYSKMVQSEVERYESSSSPAKIGVNPESDSVLMDSVTRIGKLTSLLAELPGENSAALLSQTSAVLQQAMSFMEDELRYFLEDFAKSAAPSTSASAVSPSAKTPKPKNFLHRRQESDSSILHHHSISYSFPLEPELYPLEEDDFPAIPEQIIEHMRAIVTVMVSVGYEKECCQLYSMMRRNAFKSALKRRGFQKQSIDEIGKMNWDQLEAYIVTWNRVVRHTSKILFPRECHLCNQVFSAFPSIVEGIMTSLAKGIVILFHNLAEAVAMTKRDAERLFKLLEISESLTELISTMASSMQSKKTANELKSEISVILQRLGEAAVAMFLDLENILQNDTPKNTVPGGGVHPLTRYTINYLRCACDFKSFLDEVFQQSRGEQSSKRTPFAVEVLKILKLLDANLDAKSKQYKDHALRSIFLMNNGRYILQMIKESPTMHEAVGTVASRKRSTELRSYHKSYQRVSWGKALQCLNQEGLQVNNKVHKPILKERFKNFNQMFEEIHKTQSSWVVSDEQLQSELRASISSVMIPAYRSFVARFGQYFTPGRQVEKYIKYQPEDIETIIEGLFDGNPNSGSKSRR